MRFVCLTGNFTDDNKLLLMKHEVTGCVLCVSIEKMNLRNTTPFTYCINVGTPAVVVDSVLL